MIAAICGVSGFVGRHIKDALFDKGWDVEGIYKNDIKNSTLLREKIRGSNVVINLAGAPIIAKWSDEYKKELKSSRIDTTNALVKAISELEERPELFVSTSAIGWYDDKGIYDEYSKDAHANDFLGELCQEWEESALKAKELGVRVVIFRFGLVLGKDGGMMSKLLTPFKLGLGGTIGDGNFPMSFVHIDDLVAAELFAIGNSTLDGIYNLTAPNPTTNKIFTKTLGKLLNRPTILPIPTFALKLIFGEGAQVVSSGQHVVPKRLLESGFVFKYDTIEKALSEVVK